MILGRIVCLFKGHKRGKFSRTVEVEPNIRVGIFACPRCGRETRYKVKPAPAQSPAAPSSITVQEANAEYIAKRKV